jgi:hypothetical protein
MIADRWISGFVTLFYRLISISAVFAALGGSQFQTNPLQYCQPPAHPKLDCPGPRSPPSLRPRGSPGMTSITASHG